MRSIISLVGLSFAALGFAATTAPVSMQDLVGEGERAGTRIVVRGLKRDGGGTVTLRFQVSMRATSRSPCTSSVGNSSDGHAHLIDAANRQKYLAVKDSSGKCECSPIRGNVHKGAPVNLWVKFPAPPASVQKVTVVVDGFEPVESVPLTAR